MTVQDRIEQEHAFAKKVLSLAMPDIQQIVLPMDLQPLLASLQDPELRAEFERLYPVYTRQRSAVNRD